MTSSASLSTRLKETHQSLIVAPYEAPSLLRAHYAINEKLPAALEPLQVTDFGVRNCKLTQLLSDLLSGLNYAAEVEASRGGSDARVSGSLIG